MRLITLFSARFRVVTSCSVPSSRGMGKHNDRFIIVLDIDKVFDEETMGGMLELLPEAVNG
ncbi:hypothetical protein [Geobacter argillaceus]|uniref:Uncharacterized protein n=1 Tax=Geobacter argillaceus TaxID=345631 RepID=A0A562VK85_9BACT|nr:hypothetical protein [Geobacter argillaceus]TWJ18265.1 hypothetical protein JN12_02668 [Geobacter argillaceus]